MRNSDAVIVRYITRRDFLRQVGGAAAGTAIAAVLGGCGGQAPTTSPAAAPTAASAAAVGGQLDFFSWEGYDMLSATEAWRQANKIDLKSGYIASSEDTPAKVLSPAGKGIDLITYAHCYYKTWTDLGVMTEFTDEEVPNIKRMYPFFQNAPYFRKPDGSHIGIPLTWLNYVCNYRADLIDPPANWADLLGAKYKGTVAIVEDPGALILVASAVLGLPTETMTKAQLEEVKKFLVALKANAKTIAPSYGDLTNLLVSGEAAATFLGWGALDVWASNEGVDVRSVLPADGVLTMVDVYAIPSTCDNRTTALAWLNQMLSDEVQLSVVNDLVTATVCPDVVPLIVDEKTRNLYDYDGFEAMMAAAPLPMFPPSEASGDQVSFGDWMKMWEDVKAA